MTLQTGDDPLIADSPAWANVVVGILFGLAVGQFAACMAWSLGQPVLGFRPTQTAISVVYMLQGQGWLANIVPVFGEPWVFAQEFPLYQWMVAALVKLSAIPIDPAGRLVTGGCALAVALPIWLTCREFAAKSALRITLTLTALWLLAPVGVYWDSSFLIETTTVFISATWLAFYVRMLQRRTIADIILCFIFGALAASVKITTFSGFVFCAFLYTLMYLWSNRLRWRAALASAVLGAASVAVSAAALLIWNHYTSAWLVQNPLSTLLLVSSTLSFLFGTLSDRWSPLLWGYAIWSRDLPEALGKVWFLPFFFGLSLLLIRRRLAIAGVCLALVASWLSVYFIFPVLHIENVYYQVENVLFLCAAVTVLFEGTLQLRQPLVAFGLLAVTVVSQLNGFYFGTYGKVFFQDERQYPLYPAAHAVAQLSAPDSVAVVFGTDWGAEIPYYSNRRGIVVANWFPNAAVEKILFDDPAKWLGGRSIGSVVDCNVFANEKISDDKVKIRDRLLQSMGPPLHFEGKLFFATVANPSCDVYIARH